MKQYYVEYKNINTCTIEWRLVSKPVVEKFKDKTGAKIKQVPIPHMMIWKNPDLVCEEILRWCKC